MSSGRIFVIGVLIFIFIVLIATESGRRPQSERPPIGGVSAPPPDICVNC